MIKVKLLFFLCLGLPQLWSQTLDSRLIGIETEIAQLMEAYHTVGLSVAIVENNQVIYTKGFGYRDLDQKLPTSPNTRFQIGSVTKQFTAALIGILEGQGKLSIEDKPATHIKDLKFYSDEMNRLVRIKDLLAHSSGIGTVDGTQVFFPTNDINQHLQRLPYLKPNSLPRERFDYSNMGYAILGAIGEKITQQSWANNLQKLVFEPLEMHNSLATLSELYESHDFSKGYSVRDNEALEVPSEDQHESAASGAMSSTANDMAKWMLMLLNKGRYKGEQIVPQPFIENSFNSHSVIRPGFSFEEKPNLLFDHYGYGWFVHNYKNMYRVNHGGNVSGFTALIELYPYKNLGIVVLTNQHLSGIAHNISNMIGNRMLELERKTWNEYEVHVPQARQYGQTLTPLNLEKKPTHAFSSFCGTYRNEGYGTLEIYQEDDTLFVKLPAFTFALEHQYHNIFIHKSLVEIHQNCPIFSYHFLMNDYGEITSLAMDLQAEPVVFEKLIP